MPGDTQLVLPGYYLFINSLIHLFIIVLIVLPGVRVVQAVHVRDMSNVGDVA